MTKKKRYMVFEQEVGMMEVCPLLALPAPNKAPN